MRYLARQRDNWKQNTDSLVVSGDALILRDLELRRKPDGNWTPYYAYGDGRIVEAASDDGNLDAWEKRHAIVPSISQ